MWGICLDISLCDGKLFQRAVEYQPAGDDKAQMIRPVSGTETYMRLIRPVGKQPGFTYGERVCIADHPEITGTVTDIIFRFNVQEFAYFIHTDDRKISRRFLENELRRT